MQNRVLGPPVAKTTIAFGRSYTGGPGTVLDVPQGDADVLSANGWVLVCASGPTSARPPATTSSLPYIAGPGFKFFDQTLNQLIVFDGQFWRNPVDGSLLN